MAMIIAGIVLAALVALTAGAGYYVAQKPIYQVQPGLGVRVGDPGHNLVGPNWSGDPAPGESTKGTAESATKEAG